MATNGVLDAGVSKGPRHPNPRLMLVNTSYLRTDFGMVQVVYRAQAIQRLAGSGVARVYLICQGAQASLIDRVIAALPATLRR